jgi:hypothetical protein
MRQWPVGRIVATGAVLIILGLVANAVANSRAEKRWLMSFGADPDDPATFFTGRVHAGMSLKQVAAMMPGPTRIERYIVPTVGDSSLLERYIYRLATTDWPVDVYYDRRGEVVDLYFADNPNVARSLRSMSADEAAAWAGRTK